MLLTKDQIFNALDLPTKDVAVPEWGGSVRVRTLSGTERDAFESSIMVGRGKDRTVNLLNMRAKLVAATVVDDLGCKVFNEGDVKELGKKSSAALDRVFGVAQDLSGLGDKDVQKLAGDLKVAQSNDSTSS